jgi:carbon storage regulator
MEVNSNVVPKGSVRSSNPQSKSSLNSINSSQNGNLTLVRRVNESIIIGDDITLTVVELKGHQVKVTISAPKKVLVNRLEVHKKIMQMNAITQ